MRFRLSKYDCIRLWYCKVLSCSNTLSTRPNFLYHPDNLLSFFLLPLISKHLQYFLPIMVTERLLMKSQIVYRRYKCRFFTTAALLCHFYVSYDLLRNTVVDQRWNSQRMFIECDYNFVYIILLYFHLFSLKLIGLIDRKWHSDWWCMKGLSCVSLSFEKEKWDLW